MFSFGYALAHLERGHKVTRQGWNGQGMYVVLQAGYPDGIPVNANTARATGLPEGTTATFRPYLMMKTIHENEFVPWVASQTDLLAHDWAVIP